MGLESVSGSAYSSDCVCSTDLTYIYQISLDVFKKHDVDMIPFLTKLHAVKHEIISNIRTQRLELVQKNKSMLETFHQKEQVLKKVERDLEKTVKQTRNLINFHKFHTLEKEKIKKINKILTTSTVLRKLTKKKTEKIAMTQTKQEGKETTPTKTKFENFRYKAVKIKRKKYSWQPSSDIQDNLNNWNSFKKTEIYDTGMYEMPLFTGLSMNVSKQF